MAVPSLQFLAFVIIGAGLYNLSQTAAWQQAVLLGLNVLFLFSFSRDPIAFLPLAGFLAFGFAAVRVLQGGGTTRSFLPLLLVTISVFFWLKQYAFLPQALFWRYPYVTIGLSYIFWVFRRSCG